MITVFEKAITSIVTQGGILLSSGVRVVAHATPGIFEAAGLAASKGLTVFSEIIPVAADFMSNKISDVCLACQGHEGIKREWVLLDHPDEMSAPDEELLVVV